MERFKKQKEISQMGDSTLIIPKCAICGENLVFVLDRVWKTLEIYPCVCQEMALFEIQETWFPELSNTGNVVPGIIGSQVGMKTLIDTYYK